MHRCPGHKLFGSGADVCGPGGEWTGRQLLGARAGNVRSRTPTFRDELSGRRPGTAEYRPKLRVGLDLATAVRGQLAGVLEVGFVRVCFIAHDAELGAVGKGIVELAEGMRLLGVESVAVLPGRRPLTRALQRQGVPVLMLPVPWWCDRYDTPAGRIGRSMANLVLTGPFAAAFRILRCDVVYTHTVVTGVGGMAACLAAVPHVWHVHEYGYEDHRLHFDFGFERTARLVGRWSAAVICVSKALARRYESFVPAARLHVIYQSVTVRPDAEAEEKAIRERCQVGRALRLILVGEVKEGKGQVDAVRGTALLARDGIDTELLLVGNVEPSYGRYLRQTIEELGIGDRVRFVGWVENPYPLVRSADVALMCSRSEAFGRVTVEAMLAGKPVVGARAGATPELVREGFNGLLYSPGDAAELARQVAVLHRHPQRAREMGEAGRRWAARTFTVQRYAAEVAQVLRAAAGVRQAEAVSGSAPLPRRPSVS